jgi:hypothetical protein
MKAKLVILALLGLLSIGTQAAPQVDPSIVPETMQLLRSSIAELENSPATGQYYRDGVFHSPNDQGLWDYLTGPAAAAAILWRSTGGQDPDLLAVAEQTFDRAIASHQASNGSFLPGPDPGPNAQSPDIATIWFCNELGTAYLELAPALGRERQIRWRRALTRGADFLIATDGGWYINGNDMLAETTVFYLAWRATGDPIYEHAYNAEWAWTLHPPQSRWPGFGLHVVAGIARASSGQRLIGPAGYLAESNPGPPGYDPYYTTTQLDTAVNLYVLSRDPRALRLADMLINAQLPRVNQSWYLDTSDGTRHWEPNTEVPFLTSGVVVLAMLGHRPDLVALTDGQFAMIERHYRATSAYYPPDYIGLSDELAVILEAAADR